jgi:hypothetical protein
MADIDQVRVMISSRSEVPVFKDPQRLSSVRKELQAFLQAIRWSQGERLVGVDGPLFRVRIHENWAGAAAEKSTLQLSIDEIERADIVIVLYTGEAGSAEKGSPIGICHAELQCA